MSNKLPVVKTVAWAYSAVLAFATAFIVGGILLDKQDKEAAKKSNVRHE
jgi:hypothetical protein